MTNAIILRVDPDKCQGHAHCSALAPELFRLDEFGYAHHAIDGHVPPGLVEKAYIPRANCPEEAIIIESTSAGDDESPTG